MADTLSKLHRDIVNCTACPRLVAWREHAALEKRKAYRSHSYWGRPVPGFGDANARIVIVGLAPAAHGANRTGRAFTGDRSGDFLYAALHRAGLANQPTATSRDDGLALHDVFIVMPCRCAPPDNKPVPSELANCSPFLDREVALLGRKRVFLALGAIAWRAVLDHHARIGAPTPTPRPAFSHGSSVDLGGVTLLGSYHVSQQNTQTGRLTAAMIDRILATAQSVATASISVR